MSAFVLQAHRPALESSGIAPLAKTDNGQARFSKMKAESRSGYRHFDSDESVISAIVWPPGRAKV